MASLDEVPAELSHFHALIAQNPEPGYDIVYVALSTEDDIYLKMFKEDVDAIVERIKREGEQLEVLVEVKAPLAEVCK